MVIRLDSNRVKDIVNNKVAPLGVDGDSSANRSHGVSEADSIVESARQSMASAGLVDDPESAEKTGKEILDNMANQEQRSETDLSLNERPELPSVDILSSVHAPRETH